MKKSRYLIICLLSVVILVIGSLSISGAQELSEIEQIQIDMMMAAFKIDPTWAMGLMENFAKTTPKLAAVAILELAKATPEMAVMAVANLAKTSPEVAVRGLLAITITSIELAETQLEMKQALEEIVIKAVVQMVEETPHVAAIVMASLFQVSPALGTLAKQKIVAAGMGKEYLEAATPITPITP